MARRAGPAETPLPTLMEPSRMWAAGASDATAALGPGSALIRTSPQAAITAQRISAYRRRVTVALGGCDRVRFRDAGARIPVSNCIGRGEAANGRLHGPARVQVSGHTRAVRRPSTESWEDAKFPVQKRPARALDIWSRSRIGHQHVMTTTRRSSNPGRKEAPHATYSLDLDHPVMHGRDGGHVERQG